MLPVAREPGFAWRAARPRLVAVAIYAIAMAYVESAAVLYLRTIYGGIDPVGPRSTPFNPIPDFVWIEIGREGATMIMLGCVGFLAGRGVAGRIGMFAMAMGVWDISYYVFLWLFSGWPPTLLAPDVLFLIPLPWWGPVLAPVMSAAVMVIVGAVALARDLGDGVPPMTRASRAGLVVGVLMCLYAFMAEALHRFIEAGFEAAYYVRGGAFDWPIFCIGLVVCALAAWGWLGRATPCRS